MREISFSEAVSFLHHGVEGQKWGVRNGPPYPLDRKEIAKNIKSKAKAGLKEAKKYKRSSAVTKATIAGFLLSGGPIGAIFWRCAVQALSKNARGEFRDAKDLKNTAKEQYKNAQDLVKKFKNKNLTDKDLELLQKQYVEDNNALRQIHDEKNLYDPYKRRKIEPTLNVNVKNQ